MKIRIAAFLAFTAFFMMAGYLFRVAAGPVISTDLALAQVQDSDVAAASLRTYNQSPNLPIVLVAIIVSGLVFFSPEIRKLIVHLKNKHSLLIIPFMLAIVLLGGCTKYDTPEYVEVDTNETAFVIPLEGNTSKQVAFDSAEKLNQAKVAAKRIQITHRWNQTGRLYLDGDWIGNVRVIKVSRTPVTREWTANTGSGSVKDSGLWSESSDSVGFSTGVSCTAMIAEADTALFLYSYQGNTLQGVMDGEVRARIQSVLSEFAAGFAMDKLRDQKDQMIKAIRADVVPFFAAKGITITTLGQFGGFTYENPKIQESIDAVFVAQQEKQIAAAQLAAQKDKNTRLEQEGQGEASKLREIAKGQKDAAVTAAEGEAGAIKLVADAAANAAQNPVFIELKKIEVQSQQIGRWDGKYPTYMMTTGGGAPNLLLNMPAPQ